MKTQAKKFLVSVVAALAILASLFAVSLMTACGENESDYKSDYEWSYTPEFKDACDDDMKIDGVLDESVWTSSDRQWIELASDGAVVKHTAYYTAKGLYIASTVTDPDLYWNGRFNFSTNAGTKALNSAFYYTITDKNTETLSTSTRMRFAVDAYNAASYEQTRFTAKAVANGDVKKGEATEMTSEFFATWKALNIEVDEETGVPEYVYILPRYRKIGDPDTANANKWIAPTDAEEYRQETYARFDANGYMSNVAESSLWGNAASGLSYSPGWDTSRSNESIVTTAVGHSQHIFVRDVYSDRFSFSVDMTVNGGLQTMDGSDGLFRGGLCVSASAKGTDTLNWYFDGAPFESNKYALRRLHTSPWSDVLAASGDLPDGYDYSTSAKKVNVKLIKDRETFYVVVEGKLVYIASENDFMGKVSPGAYTLSASATFSNPEVVDYSDDVDGLYAEIDEYADRITVSASGGGKVTPNIKAIDKTAATKEVTFDVMPNSGRVLTSFKVNGVEKIADVMANIVDGKYTTSFGGSTTFEAKFSRIPTENIVYIRTTVVDSDGDALPGVPVIVRSTNSMFTATATTNNNGKFEAAFLKPQTDPYVIDGVEFTVGDGWTATTEKTGTYRSAIETFEYSEATTADGKTVIEKTIVVSDALIVSEFTAGGKTYKSSSTYNYEDEGNNHIQILTGTNYYYAYFNVYEDTAVVEYEFKNKLDPSEEGNELAPGVGLAFFGKNESVNVFLVSNRVWAPHNGVMSQKDHGKAFDVNAVDGEYIKVRYVKSGRALALQWYNGAEWETLYLNSFDGLMGEAVIAFNATSSAGKNVLIDVKNIAVKTGAEATEIANGLLARNIGFTVDEEGAALGTATIEGVTAGKANYGATVKVNVTTEHNAIVTIGDEVYWFKSDGSRSFTVTADVAINVKFGQTKRYELSGYAAGSGISVTCAGQTVSPIADGGKWYIDVPQGTTVTFSDGTHMPETVAAGADEVLTFAFRNLKLTPTANGIFTYKADGTADISFQTADTNHGAVLDSATSEIVGKSWILTTKIDAIDLTTWNIFGFRISVSDGSDTTHLAMGLSVRSDAVSTSALELLAFGKQWSRITLSDTIKNAISGDVKLTVAYDYAADTYTVFINDVKAGTFETGDGTEWAKYLKLSGRRPVAIGIGGRFDDNQATMTYSAWDYAVKSTEAHETANKYDTMACVLGMHDYVGEQTKPSTCTEKGETTYTCKYCDHAYTLADVAKVAHIENGSGACSVCGYVKYSLGEVKGKDGEVLTSGVTAFLDDDTAAISGEFYADSTTSVVTFKHANYFDKTVALSTVEDGEITAQFTDWKLVPKRTYENTTVTYNEADGSFKLVRTADADRNIGYLIDAATADIVNKSWIITTEIDKSEIGLYNTFGFYLNASAERKIGLSYRGNKSSATTIVADNEVDNLKVVTLLPEYTGETPLTSEMQTYVKNNSKIKLTLAHDYVNNTYSFYVGGLLFKTYTAAELNIADGAHPSEIGIGGHIDHFNNYRPASGETPAITGYVPSMTYSAWDYAVKSTEAHVTANKYDTMACALGMHDTTVTQTVNATCISDGYKKHDCKYCSYTYNETLAATGVHVDSDNDNNCDTTGCTAAKYTFEVKNPSGTVITDYTATVDGTAVTSGGFVNAGETIVFSCTDYFDVTATAGENSTISVQFQSALKLVKSGAAITDTYSNENKTLVASTTGSVGNFGFFIGKAEDEIAGKSWIMSVELKTSDVTLIMNWKQFGFVVYNDEYHATSVDCRHIVIGLRKNGSDGQTSGSVGTDYTSATQSWGVNLSVLSGTIATTWDDSDTVKLSLAYDKDTNGFKLYVNGTFVREFTDSMLKTNGKAPTRIGIGARFDGTAGATSMTYSNWDYAVSTETDKYADMMCAAGVHTYNAGEETKPATCYEAGVKTFTCTNASCAHSYTEAIARLNHVDENSDGECDNNCGEKLYTISASGKTKTLASGADTLSASTLTAKIGDETIAISSDDKIWAKNTDEIKFTHPDYMDEVTVSATGTANNTLTVEFTNFKLTTKYTDAVSTYTYDATANSYSLVRTAQADHTTYGMTINSATADIVNKSWIITTEINKGEIGLYNTYGFYFNAGGDRKIGLSYRADRNVKETGVSDEQATNVKVTVYKPDWGGETSLTADMLAYVKANAKLKLTLAYDYANDTYSFYVGGLLFKTYTAAELNIADGAHPSEIGIGGHMDHFNVYKPANTTAGTVAITGYVPSMTFYNWDYSTSGNAKYNKMACALGDHSWCSTDTCAYCGAVKYTVNATGPSKTATGINNAVTSGVVATVGGVTYKVYGTVTYLPSTLTGETAIAFTHPDYNETVSLNVNAEKTFIVPFKTWKLTNAGDESATRTLNADGSYTITASNKVFQTGGTIATSTDIANKSWILSTDMKLADVGCYNTFGFRVTIGTSTESKVRTIGLSVRGLTYSSIGDMAVYVYGYDSKRQELSQDVKTAIASLEYVSLKLAYDYSADSYAVYVNGTLVKTYTATDIGVSGERPVSLGLGANIDHLTKSEDGATVAIVPTMTYKNWDYAVSTNTAKYNALLPGTTSD